MKQEIQVIMKVKPHYMAVLNLNYDATKDKRPYPFCDLRNSGLMVK